MSVEEALLAHLRHQNTAFEILEHAHAQTSGEVALARGTPLQWGGKSLVLKLGKTMSFAIFALSGARKTNNRAIRKHLGVQRLRFATPDELLTLTGLTPGCVPPFGRPVFDLPLYVDTASANQPRIAFSLGSHTRSALMATPAYLQAARPQDVFSFSQDESHPME